MPFLAGLLGLISLGVIAPWRSAAAMDFDQVVGKARHSAGEPYQAPPAIPDFLVDLSYQDYQGIRFKPSSSLWAGSASRFQVMMVSPGLFFRHPVKLNVVDGEGTHEVPYRKSDYTFNDEQLGKRVPADLGHGGFKLTYPLKDGENNQFLVFAGASYFRAVGRDNSFGLSARGLAVNTGLASGEQFPLFREFWLKRPDGDDQWITLYALLDGPQISGAYRFKVHPNDTTEMEVSSRLFVRKDIERLGVAPLTSMFYYGGNTGRPDGEWRPRVHDSDGLLIYNKDTSEWLWRPLFNPASLSEDDFVQEKAGGFGLMQRQTDFEDFQDFGTNYHSRPSAWVTPTSDWGPGRVTLVQLPTRDETNDNIVAFWTPDDPVREGDELSFDYRLTVGGPTIDGSGQARAVKTFIGDGNRVGGGQVEGAYRVIVDFAGGPLDAAGPDAAVTSQVSASQGGKVIEHFVEFLAPVNRWRLSILALPEEDQPLELRAFLRKGEDTVSETWSYQIPRGDEPRTGGN